MLTPISALKPDVSAVIFGGRSWLGFWLAEALASSGHNVCCTTAASTIELPVKSQGTVTYTRVAHREEAVALLRRCQPGLVFNLSIGIDEAHAELHQAVVQTCRDIGSYLVLTSSALALDGYSPDTKLNDKLPAKSVSAYGQFKANCEQQMLAEQGLSSMILRFSSIHGWSPWKDSRTVAFLKKVAAGEQIIVDLGVIQNRLTDQALASAVVNLAEKQRTGVVHLGTNDSSEELAFLKRLAREFGYSDEGIQAGGQRQVNLAVIPSENTHAGEPLSEADTLQALRQNPNLSPLARMQAT